MQNTMVNTKHSLDITWVRDQFPILDQEVNGHPLAYFDNAATTQKPLSVINALSDYYTGYNANIHRGIHSLAEKATSAFEATREAVQQFINAPEKEEIIFTKGTSESINLVAATYGRANVNAGDEVIVTGMEHHSNIVPWQMLCEEKGAHLKVVNISDSGEMLMEEFTGLLSDRTKMVAVGYASNALGTINPVTEIIRMAHEQGAVVLLDAAQAAPHLEVDVKKLNCDFLAFSGHKMYGPNGVGVLYGKRKLLEAMPPYQGGGEMISEVSFDGTTYADIPYKFEAGTPNIADVIALKPAVEFIQTLGKEKIQQHELGLLKQATRQLRENKKVKIFADLDNKVSVLSFTLENMHAFDAGMLLDSRGIAVRTGHHCAQPLMDRYGIDGTIRASFAVYNTLEEVERLVTSVDKISSR